MDPVLEEAAAYFKRQPGFERALQKLWEKWRSYGRFAGIVDLGSPQKDEKKALEGLFGVGLVRNGKLRFHSADFEEALSKTRFSSVSLKQLLEAYYGATLISKKDDEEKLLEEKKKLYGQALRIVSENNAPTGTALLLEEKTKEAGTFPISVRWLNSLSMQKLWQMKQNASSDAECLSQVSKIGKALTLLEQTDPQKGIRLAVLAMECTSDPHGFDRGTALGRNLLGALPVLFGEAAEFSPRLSAEDALERYVRAGIRPDDLSSFTTIYRILLEDENGVIPVYEEMAKRQEPMLVSLLNLRSVTKAIPAEKKVYVLENQMVFSQLCESCPKASLLCTSGQPRTASLMLLDLLCREETEIWYSGDLDPEGIGIADRLIVRSRGRIRPWHMGAEDYVKSMSDVEISKTRMTELDQIRTQELFEAAGILREKGRAGYQEKLLREMEEEIKNSI